MKRNRILGIYDTHEEALAHLTRLQASPNFSNMSIVSPSRRQRLPVSIVSSRDVASAGAVSGFYWGAGIGLIAGFIWFALYGETFPYQSEGARFTITLLLGLVFGAVFGTLIGTLSASSMTQSLNKTFTDHFFIGKHLLVMRGTRRVCNHARSLLEAPASAG